MIIGLEIEGVINRSIIKFPIGNYHDGISLGRYWESQSDSSIRMDDKFKNEETVEIVSEIIKNKSEFKDAINELREILKIDRKQRLSGRIYFNKSCGCHFHVSLSKYKFFDKSHPQIFIRTRKYFIKHLKRLNIPEELKLNILSQYDRNYSKIVSEEFIKNNDYREREFNFLSETENKGLEWRSFNLCGVKKWKELKILLNLAYKTLKYLEKQSKFWKDYEKSEIEIDKNKYFYNYIEINKKNDEIIDIKFNNKYDIIIGKEVQEVQEVQESSEFSGYIQHV